MAKKPYHRPELKEIERVTALLMLWAEWRGNVRQVMGLRMSPQCNLGRVVRMARQEGEIWEHNTPEDRPIFDDALLLEVDRIVSSLPSECRAAVLLTYCEGRFMAPWKRAKRLSLSRRGYYRRLYEAHEIISEQINWREVLVV